MKIKLYKAHQSGKVGWWAGEVLIGPHGSGASLKITHAKTLDGQVSSSLETIHGKNIGRANETTPYEQACKELESKANKKIDRGYSKEIPEEGQQATNALGLCLPQKALKLQDLKTPIDWDNAYVQRKLDGHRLMCKDGVLYSSGGKPIELPHIQDLVKNVPIHLDGELYIHGKTLREIGKLVKKYRPGETEKLEYWIFDSVSDASFAVRFNELIENTDNLPLAIKLVNTYKVESMDEVMQYHKQFLAEGYEGTMIRQGTEPYKPGSRCKDIIKIKDMDDQEFTVLDIIEGKPKLYRGKMLQQAVFVMANPRGEAFTALAHGTVPEKADIYANRSKHIGKQVTIQHFGWTDFDVPNLPVAKGFREDL